MELVTLMLLAVFLITWIFFLRRFEWTIKEIRSICERPSGYIKLAQLLFLMMVTVSFVALLVYYFFYNEQTSKLDVFLTIIVGFMGTIVGFFFKDSALDKLDPKIKDAAKKSERLLEKAERILKANKPKMK